METENRSTAITSFVLWGFSDNLPVNLFLFFIFLFIYVLTLLGNIVIMVVTSHLPSPMYFLLGHLAFLDICLSSVTVPKLLEILTEKQTISYSACFVQMFFILLTGSNEGCILAAMAYDRYAAICKPLHYVQIMKKACCRRLVGGAWTITFSHSLINTFSALKLSFCRENFIRHFSCELPSLFALSCTETLSNWILFFITGSVIVICSFTLILFSYIHIISTILKLNSTEAKRKTFSTCTSHLIVVVLYYSTGCFRYMRPSSASSIIVDELFSVQYSISTPMLNPIIYSLKNKEVKEAIKKLVKGKLLLLFF
ncbi:olfactory receptor 5V1-like [Protobothrops mucrosquamatus]|uniref:olfactory receptor 5V1-like n=1 Tax=Protobothrops mucrosquamatus TaxID=103944 RepID=UPI0010FBB7EC|nr:olfactory receptor 5V1-like [Protobothrops mucrosquamatus]